MFSYSNQRFIYFHGEPNFLTKHHTWCKILDACCTWSILRIRSLCPFHVPIWPTDWFLCCPGRSTIKLESNAVTRWLRYGFGLKFSEGLVKRDCSKLSSLRIRTLLSQCFCIPVRIKLTIKGRSVPILVLISKSFVKVFIIVSESPNVTLIIVE